MDDLCCKIISGDVRAASRLMRMVDDRVANYEEYMKVIWQHSGKADIIGITGVPGGGKSTLTSKLISKYRKIGKSVGVVAVDPTSPFSGGAILGDRIRMMDHAIDDSVFIRSIGTRGFLGGLSLSTMDIVAIMDAMGKDIIIIETVGVGQDEVEISRVVDSCIVVTLPGMGDSIQAMKAGVFEIADIFVINKADRDGVEKVVSDLKMLLDKAYTNDEWHIPIIKTISIEDEGIEELFNAINVHKQYSCKELKKIRLKSRLTYVTFNIVREQIFKKILTNNEVTKLVSLGKDPYTIADILLKKYYKS